MSTLHILSQNKNKCFIHIFPTVILIVYATRKIAIHHFTSYQFGVILYNCFFSRSIIFHYKQENNGENSSNERNVERSILINCNNEHFPLDNEKSFSKTNKHTTNQSFSLLFAIFSLFLTRLHFYLARVFFARDDFHSLSGFFLQFERFVLPSINKNWFMCSLHLNVLYIYDYCFRV